MAQTLFTKLNIWDSPFIYHFHDASQVRISDRRGALSSFVEKVLSEEIRWNEDYVIIDELRRCSRYFIVVSDTDFSKISVSGSTQINDGVNLASVDGNLNATVRRGKVFSYHNGKSGTPMYHAIKPAFVDRRGGGIGFRAAVEYFRRGRPRPAEVDIRRYGDQKVVFEIQSRSGDNNNDSLYAFFNEVGIEELIGGYESNTAEAVVVGSSDVAEATRLHLQKRIQSSYETDN